MVLPIALSRYSGAGKTDGRYYLRKLFDAISREVPLISTIYPNHPVYTHWEEFDRAGGLGAAVKEMVKAGKIDADADGMFGTIRQKAGTWLRTWIQNVIHPVAEPISEQGGLAVLHGNIEPDSAIVKIQRSSGSKGGF